MDRNTLHKVTRRKANWAGHTLRRNCLLKHVIEGKIDGRLEVTGRRERRRQRLLENLKESRGYWKFEEKALNFTGWRTRFGRGYESVVKTDYAVNCMDARVQATSR